MNITDDIIMCFDMTINKFWSVCYYILIGLILSTINSAPHYLFFVLNK